MTNSTLVTTAIEATWPHGSDHILFLGSWCRKFDRKPIWKNRNYSTVPYHWDDRKKLQTDYDYINQTYENLLGELANQLNRIHAKEYSERYWRILLGPWLGYFIQVLFDRWFMINYAFSNYDIQGCKILNTSRENYIPTDMSHFQRMFVSDDWNERLFGELVRLCYPSKSKFCKASKIVQGYSIENPSHGIASPKQVIKLSIARKLSRLLVRKNECFLLSTYLPRKEELKLQCLLLQFPKVWYIPESRDYETNVSLRNSIFGSTVAKIDPMDFYGLARHFVSLFLPKVYLEGFAEQLSDIQKLRWPQNPKLIFTSNADIGADLFKRWSAEQVESGVPLFIGQHGGNFGMTPFSFHEEHQIRIADKFLSWGWTDDNRKNIVPTGNLKLFNKRIPFNPKGHALMIELTVPRYSYHLYSFPVAGQWLDYFNEQIEFIKCVPDEIRKNLVIRLNKSDHGWCQKSRFLEYFPQLEIDDGFSKIDQLTANSRICISTYNATSYLESMCSNIPTLMFWKPDHWELNESAAPWFDLLKAVGIFHTSPSSAAAHLELYWDNLEEWWMSQEVQKVKNDFIGNYSYIPNKPIKMLQKLLKSDCGQHSH